MNATQELPKMVLEQPSEFVYDKRENNWELLENVPLAKGKISLQLDEFLKPGVEYVPGEVMMGRAKEMGNLAGQFHAERFLDQESNVPEEWWVFTFIFPGTCWRNPDGNLYVPCAGWDDGKVRLGFRRLDEDFGSGCRIVRLTK